MDFYVSNILSLPRYLIQVFLLIENWYLHKIVVVKVVIIPNLYNFCTPTPILSCGEEAIKWALKKSDSHTMVKKTVNQLNIVALITGRSYAQHYDSGPSQRRKKYIFKYCCK